MMTKGQRARNDRRPLASLLALGMTALVLAASAPLADAEVVFTDGRHRAFGVLAQGEVDDIREDIPETQVCGAAMRFAQVSVSIRPASAGDRVSVTVNFVDFGGPSTAAASSGPQSVVLTAKNPRAEFFGFAPDTCITPVTVTGLSVLGQASYFVIDA